MGEPMLEYSQLPETVLDTLIDQLDLKDCDLYPTDDFTRTQAASVQKFITESNSGVEIVFDRLNGRVFLTAAAPRATLNQPNPCASVAASKFGVSRRRGKCR